jgi:hypothetical protein
MWPPQGASGTIDPSAPPLPTSVATIEYWHSEKQCTPASWIGQKARIPLAGVGAPVVASDPGFFKGHVVGQASLSGVALWANRALSPALIPAGTTPWSYFIGRFRSSAGPSQIIYGMGDPGDEHSAYKDTTPKWIGYFGAVINGPPVDTNAHVVKQWLDGTRANITIDRTNYSALFGGVLATAVTSVALGSGSSGLGNPTDGSIAFFLVCASKPTDAEIATLDAWAASYWGVPDSPPLPAAIHSWWSGSHGMTPANAFDQMPTGITLLGTSVLAVDLPIVGLDPGFFNGQPVGQFNRNAYWGRTGLVTTLLAGDRPWIYYVARVRSIVPAIQSLGGIGVGIAAQAYPNFGVGDPAWYVSGVSWNAGGIVAVNTLPHRIKTWVAGTIANLTIDDVPSTSFGGGALATSTTSIWMGIDPGGNSPIDGCIALFLISKSKPTAAEEAALDAWVKAFYGLP